jgi:formylglycine-generating enzyme required for sulfatase activity
MSNHDNTRKSDLVLGGQDPPPVAAAVLGGIAGKKQKLAQKLGLSINDELPDKIFEQLGISENLAYELSENHDLFGFETFTINSYGEIISITKKHAFYYTENLGNDVTLDMVYIPAGSFMMGSNQKDFEQPIHQVTLKSFYLAKYPTTQAQYMAVIGNNPSHFQGDDRHPVDNVSRKDAIEFYQRLSKLTDKNYTLPSESQWEYTCRAGTTTPFSCGDTITTDFANYDGYDLAYKYSDEPTGVFLKKTTPVGEYPPNSWGLYDMHGNVWERCLDNKFNDSISSSYFVYHYANYENAPVDGNALIDSVNGNSHVYRGGSWCYIAKGCRSSERNFDVVCDFPGFRVCSNS